MGISNLFSRFRKKKDEPKVKGYSKLHHDTSNIQYMLDNISTYNDNVKDYHGVLIDESASVDDIYKIVDKLLWDPSFLSLFLTSFPIATYDNFTEFICDAICSDNNSKKGEIKSVIAQYGTCAEAFDKLMDNMLENEERRYEQTMEEFKILETSEDDFDPIDNSDPEETYFNQEIIDIPADELAIEVIED